MKGIKIIYTYIGYINIEYVHKNETLNIPSDFEIQANQLIPEDHA